MFLVFFCVLFLFLSDILRNMLKNLMSFATLCDHIRFGRCIACKCNGRVWWATQQLNNLNVGTSAASLDIQVELGNDLRAEVRAEAGCGGSCEIKSQRSQHDADCKAVQMTKV